jgi:hypothetical protein
MSMCVVKGSTLSISWQLCVVTVAWHAYRSRPLCVPLWLCVCAVVAVRGPADPRAGSRVRTYRWSEQPVAHPTHFSLHGCTVGAQPSYGRPYGTRVPSTWSPVCGETHRSALCGCCVRRSAAVCREVRLCAEKICWVQGGADGEAAAYKEEQQGCACPSPLP